MGIAPRAPGYFALIGGKPPPITRRSFEASRKLNRLLNRNCFLSGSWSWSIGLSIHTEAISVASSALQEAQERSLLASLAINMQVTKGIGLFLGRNSSAILPNRNGIKAEDAR